MLDPGTLKTFLSNALLTHPEGGCYEKVSCMQVNGLYAQVRSKRFLEADSATCHENPCPTATFIAVKTEEEDFWTEEGCGNPGARWKPMQELGSAMWGFLMDRIPHFQSSPDTRAVLVCNTYPAMVIMRKNGTRVFVKGGCWDETVTGQDGLEYIHASMYSLAFPPNAAFQWSRVSAPGEWDVSTSTETRKCVQRQFIAFAMGAHHRLGHNSHVQNVFTDDLLHLLHDLCFRTHWSNISSEDARYILEYEAPVV